MRKSLSACVLLLALCCPAVAGDMLTPPISPPTAKSTAAPNPDEEISDPAPEDDPTTQDISVTGIAVSLLESLLAII